MILSDVLYWTATTRTTMTEGVARPTSSQRTDYALGSLPAPRSPTVFLPRACTLKTVHSYYSL